eukprot:3359620-Rhodomonas_salina.2
MTLGKYGRLLQHVQRQADPPRRTVGDPGEVESAKEARSGAYRHVHCTAPAQIISAVEPDTEVCGVLAFKALVPRQRCSSQSAKEIVPPS